GGVLAVLVLALGEHRGGVVRPQLPAGRGAPEDVGGDDELADERAQFLAGGRGGAPAEDVLGAGHQRGVAGDGDVHVGEEELDVVGVRHDQGVGPQVLAASGEHGPAGVHAGHDAAVGRVVIALVDAEVGGGQPERRHLLEVAAFQRLVEGGVGGLNLLDVGVGCAHRVPSAPCAPDGEGAASGVCARATACTT